MASARTLTAGQRLDIRLADGRVRTRVESAEWFGTEETAGEYREGEQLCNGDQRDDRES